MNNSESGQPSWPKWPKLWSAELFSTKWLNNLSRTKRVWSRRRRPQVYSFKALLKLLLAALDRPRILLPIPFALAEMQARLLELLPNPPLTRDQVRLLKTDKIVSGREPTLGDLGVQARPLEEFLQVLKDKYS